MAFGAVEWVLRGNAPSGVVAFGAVEWILRGNAPSEARTIKAAKLSLR